MWASGLKYEKQVVISATTELNIQVNGYMSRDRSIIIATEFDSRQGQEIFLNSTAPTLLSNVYRRLFPLG
jgi:hypothetical protein